MRYALMAAIAFACASVWLSQPVKIVVDETKPYAVDVAPDTNSKECPAVGGHAGDWDTREVGDAIRLSRCCEHA